MSFTISFEGLLIVETVVITGVLGPLFWRSFRSKGHDRTEGGMLRPEYAPLLLAFVVVVSYLATPSVGLLRYVFFLAESAVVGFASILVFTKGDSKTAKVAIALVICVNVVNGLATKMALGGIVWGVDERTYMLEALQIGSQGGFASIRVGFYQIPTIPQLLYMFSAITSLPIEATLTIFSSIFITLFQLIIYLFSTALTEDLRAVFAIQVVSIFVPRLVIVQTVIPEAFSMILAGGALYLLLRIIALEARSPRRDFGVAMLLFLTVVFAHPSGAILVLAVLLLLTVAYSSRMFILNSGMKLGILSTSRGLSRTLFLITGALAAAYWISISQVKGVLASQLGSFFSGFLPAGGASSHPISYTPLYTASGLQYTLEWTVPVAIASAYYIARVLSARNYSWSKWESAGLVLFVTGALLVVGSFFILKSANTSNADRYLGMPGYFLLAMSLAPPVGAAFSRVGSRTLLTVFLLLLFVMVAVGPSLPDTAPDAHAAIFEPPTSSSVQFYGSTLPLYPPSSTVAAEKSFMVPVSTAALAESGAIISYSPSSYKNTRDLLGGISAGTATASSTPGIFYVVDTSLLPGFLQHVENDSNIYMSSNEFVLAGSP